MREATTVLVKDLFKKYGPFPEPIVDLGGAESDQQFREFLNYQVWDIRNVRGVDRVVDAREMSNVSTGELGTLISGDAFEHMFEIWKVSEQIGRVVRPGGLVIACVPWLYGFHDPSGDYWRFTYMALDRMFGDNGFARLESGWYDKYDPINDYLGSYYVGRKV